MFKKFLISIFILLMFSNTAIAEETFYISMEQAISIAIDSNLKLQAYKKDIAKSENDVKIANKLKNPNIFTSISFGHSQIDDPWRVGVSELIEIAKRNVRKNLAKANLELVKIAVAFEEFNIKMNVRKAYIELVYAKTILYELKEQENLFEELKKIANEKVKTKKADDMDIIQADIILAKINADINNAETLLEIALNNFNDTLNLSDYKISYDTEVRSLIDNDITSQLYTPDLNMIIPTVEDVMDANIDNRFDLRISKQEIDVAKKNLKNVLRKRVPDIELSSGYAYVNSKMSSEGNYKSGAYIEANLVNLPIFYNYSPEIKNAKIEVEQAELRYSAMKREIMDDLDSAYQKFVSTRANLISYRNKEILKKSKQMMQLSKDKYEKENFDITSLIVMEQSYREILFDFVGTVKGYYMAWVELLNEVQNEDFKLEEADL